MPCGRIVTALRADALIALGLNAQYAVDSLAQQGGPPGAMGLMPSTA